MLIFKKLFGKKKKKEVLSQMEEVAALLTKFDGLELDQDFGADEVISVQIERLHLSSHAEDILWKKMGMHRKSSATAIEQRKIQKLSKLPPLPEV